MSLELWYPDRKSWNILCGYVNHSGCSSRVASSSYNVPCSKPSVKISRQIFSTSTWKIKVFFSLNFIFTVHNSGCEKVMFSQACVKNSVHRSVHPTTDTPLGRHPRTGRHPLLGRHTPLLGRQTPSGQADTPWTGRRPLGRLTLLLGRQTPPGQADTPAQADPLGRHPPPTKMTTAVDGTHPTGMHSCERLFLKVK